MSTGRGGWRNPWGRLTEENDSTRIEIADSVICCVPGEDRTNGFFVSCFIRGQTDTSRGKKRARQVDHEAEEEANEPKKSKAEEQPAVVNPSPVEGMTVDAPEPTKPNNTVPGSKKKPKKKKAKKTSSAPIASA